MTESRPQKSVARRWAEEESEAGVASQFIRHFETLKSGEVVVLPVRVSGTGQKKRMAGQEDALMTACELKGVTYVGLIPFIGSASGKKREDWWSWIRKAVKKARAHKAKLLAFSTDRFIRSPYHNSQDSILCKKLATEEAC